MTKLGLDSTQGALKSEKSTLKDIERTLHEPYEPNEHNREYNEPKNTAQIILAILVGNSAATISDLMDACPFEPSHPP